MYLNAFSSNDIQSYLGWKGVVSGHSEKANKTVDNATSANSSLNTLMSNLIQQMRDVLNRLIQ